MIGDPADNKGDAFWDRAGEQSYGVAMYSSSAVASHLRGRTWQCAIDIAGALGVPADAQVLDLGCGDGAFANKMLAPRYRKVDGIDKAEAAIKRANADAPKHATFRAVDLVTFDYESLPHYDATFLIGILHHVKQATPAIVHALVQRTDKLIVLEPNGNNPLRKAMEYTPSYRAAGEDSFRSKDLMAIFVAAGWRTVIRRRVNLFPNFTPGFICRWLGPLEPRIENSRFWNGLCTVNAFGLTRT